MVRINEHSEVNQLSTSKELLETSQFVEHYTLQLLALSQMKFSQGGEGSSICLEFLQRVTTFITIKGTNKKCFKHWNMQFPPVEFLDLIVAQVETFKSWVGALRNLDSRDEIGGKREEVEIGSSHEVYPLESVVVQVNPIHLVGLPLPLKHTLV